MKRTEKELLTEAIVVLAGVRLSLALFSFQRTSRWAEVVGAPRRDSNTGVSVLPEALAVATRRASRLIPGATCLVQALTARTLLQRRGFKSHLRIGVARSTEDGFGAHAWLEFAGKILIGEHRVSYASLGAGEEFS